MDLNIREAELRTREAEFRLKQAEAAYKMHMDVTLPAAWLEYEIRKKTSKRLQYRHRKGE